MFNITIKIMSYWTEKLTCNAPYPILYTLTADSDMIDTKLAKQHEAKQINVVNINKFNITVQKIYPIECNVFFVIMIKAGFYVIYIHQ